MRVALIQITRYWRRRLTFTFTDGVRHGVVLDIPFSRLC